MNRDVDTGRSWPRVWPMNLVRSTRDAVGCHREWLVPSLADKVDRLNLQNGSLELGVRLGFDQRAWSVLRDQSGIGWR